MCARVCMYVCAHAVHTYMCYVYTYVCVLYLFACMRVYVIDMHACVCVCLCVSASMCLHVHTYVHRYVCVWVHVYCTLTEYEIRVKKCSNTCRQKIKFVLMTDLTSLKIYTVIFRFWYGHVTDHHL